MLAARTRTWAPPRIRHVGIVTARDLLDEGIYVVGFSFPVVPRGEARIRVQLSAAHTDEQVDRAVAAFAKVGKDLGVLAPFGFVAAQRGRADRQIEHPGRFVDCL